MFKMFKYNIMLSNIKTVLVIELIYINTSNYLIVYYYKHL